jgi:hypothetical protein
MFIAIIVLISVAGTGCGFFDESQVKQAVRERLIDPDSAKFGDFVQQDGRACIAVNAKNSMGGYTGHKVMRLEKTDGNWSVIKTDDDSRSCVYFVSEKKSVREENRKREEENRKRERERLMKEN